MTEKAGEPSKAAMEAARKWLGAQPGSKHLLYDGIYDSLARLLESFAAKARLEEHDAICADCLAAMGGKFTRCKRGAALEKAGQEKEFL